MDKKTLVIVASAFIAGFVAFASYSKVSTPSNFEECVMKNIKEAQSDKAALLVNATCRRMFPPPNIFDVVDNQ